MLTFIDSRRLSLAGRGSSLEAVSAGSTLRTSPAGRWLRWALAVAVIVVLTLIPSVAFGQAAQTTPSTPAGQAASPAATTQAAPVDTSATGPSFNLLPSLNLGGKDDDYALPIQLLLLLTVLSLAPSIVILMTCFTRLIVVFGILRQALGLQQSPPNQVIVGLAMFLTFFIMYPVLSRVHDDALKPYLAGEIGQKEAMTRAGVPMKKFMLTQTREKDLMLFMDMAKIDGFSKTADVPLHVLVPAFVISELRIAFQIGFMLFLPFLVVDLIVASVLMSMGMMMLPPVMISLPMKLLLFVLTDGWYLIVESVVKSYGTF